jgi:hypothetical protein
MKKKSVLMGVLIILAILNFRSLLLGSINLVDYIGEKLNISTIRQIDFLNETYYKIYE